MCSNEVLLRAVDAVVTSFKSHSSKGGVDAVEALKEFWLLKEAKGAHFPEGCSVKYETYSTSPPFVFYATLPGGSCFGSFEHCETAESAKQSAAKIALTNSVLNEHSGNIISSLTIDQMVSAASSSFPSTLSANSDSPVDIFRKILQEYIGKSFLSFQEKMSVFQLLHWNGNLKEMKGKGCFREEVLQHYLCRGIDDEMLSKSTVEWKNHEKLQPGIIVKELQKVENDVEVARIAGRELRFHKERLIILQEALKQLQLSGSLCT